MATLQNAKCLSSVLGVMVQVLCFFSKCSRLGAAGASLTPDQMLKCCFLSYPVIVAKHENSAACFPSRKTN
ncbi:hypothetical protein K431DRAFT_289291 [Polychaeton citri CBS 116435]|uniref:Secreted protein n=1 Tax=Polychaeton citri CBS 116435 TaxID=1314669 RepID=A0A9P4UI90_9PEZI|nr:hypothetical protein K431DRAFT_289291 [Polychaeton citri CBS 116435]